jgi:hypothetical protein
MSDKELFTIDQIMRGACQHFKVTKEDLNMRRRSQQIVFRRQITMYVCSEHTLQSLPAIGRAFGDRDHTTVMHSVRRVQRLIDNGHEGTVSDIEGVKARARAIKQGHGSDEAANDNGASIDSRMIASFRERVNFDPETGIFTRKNGMPVKNRIKFDGTDYALSKVAWALIHGYVPETKVYLKRQNGGLKGSNLTLEPRAEALAAKILKGKAGLLSREEREARIASVMHLIDLKRAGMSPKRTELNIPAQSVFVPKIIDSPRSSYCGSTAALCTGEW